MSDINAQYVFKLFIQNEDLIISCLFDALKAAFGSGISSQQTVQLGISFGIYCAQEVKFMALVLNGCGLDEQFLTKEQTGRLFRDNKKQIMKTFWLAFKKTIETMPVEIGDSATMMFIIAGDNGAGSDTGILYLE